MQAHDHEGFYILNALMEFLPLDVSSGYLPTLWTLLFRRCAQFLLLLTRSLPPPARVLQQNTACSATCVLYMHTGQC